MRTILRNINIILLSFLSSEYKCIALHIYTDSRMRSTGIIQTVLIYYLIFKEPVKAEDGAEKLKEKLRSMNWTRSTVPPCNKGMSQMNVSVLVCAVLEYLKDHQPATPEECNFQAELKAASHWHWFKENERMQFVSGPFDDIRLKKVADLALKRWTHKLNEIESQAEMEEDTEDIDEQISGDNKLLCWLADVMPLSFLRLVVTKNQTTSYLW